MQGKILKPRALGVVLFDMKRRDLPIASPCTVAWNTMTPRGRDMFCTECKTVVHDLSKMQRSEAVEFLQSRVSEQLCVKYSHDVLGNVQFADAFATAVIPANMLRPSVRALAAATAILGASALYPRSAASPSVSKAPRESSEMRAAPQSESAPEPEAEAVPESEPVRVPVPQYTISAGRYGILGPTQNVGSFNRGRPRLPEPTVKIGRATVNNGGYDPAVVRRFFKRNHAKFSYCYEKQLLTSPGLSGTVNVTFNITRDGAATDIVAAGVAPEIDACVIRVVNMIEFPKTKDSVEAVTVPLTLRTGRT